MLNLYHLKYFYDAATSKSLLSAAQQNHVSSQAVSQAIQSLEVNLGVKLLVHQKNRFQLTPQGEKLKNESIKLLKIEKTLRGAVEQEIGELTGNIEIASSGSIFHYILNPLLGKFVAKNSDVLIKSLHLPSSKTIDYLARDQISFGVLPFDSRINSYETISIGEGTYALIGKNSIKLESAKFFIKEEGPESWDFEKKYFQQFKRYPNIRGILGSWESILDYVELGLGIGLIPDFILGQNRKKFNELVMAQKLSSYKLVITFKSRKNLPESCEKFLSFIEAS